ncbi:MAG: hypothetical protein EAY65_06895 [Alphaproteobacteria bacterium]|nr:MAG: hypothetical protein EAY65_06895 [Alphaproteobacteria bacterium]
MLYSLIQCNKKNSLGSRMMKNNDVASIHRRFSLGSIVVLWAMLLCVMVLSPSLVYAQEEQESMLEQCTTDGFFDFDNEDNSQVKEMLVEIVEEITAAIEDASQNLEDAFTSSDGYRQAVGAALTLYIIFFAVTVMTGISNLTLQSGVMLLVKIGFVGYIITPDSDGYTISHYAREFFDKGGDCLIYGFHMLATTGAWSDACGDVTTAFSVLDSTVKIVFSPRMLVTIFGVMQAGPFGPIVAAALAWSVFSLFLAVLRALQVYCVALVIKAVLYGMTPVFLPMMLFERTKSMFTSWLGQLVNFTLQPVLLFAFISFFATMVYSAAQDMLPDNDVHVCYVRSGVQAALPLDINSWKPACCTGGSCRPYEGGWSLEGAVDCEDKRIFPVNHVTILTFLLLVHIMRQLCEVAVQFASEVSQGGVAIAQQGNPFSGMMGGGAAPGQQFDPSRGYSTRGRR